MRVLGEVWGSAADLAFERPPVLGGGGLDPEGSRANLVPATYVRGRPRAVKAAASAVSASLTACLNLSVSCALLYNKRKETWVQSKNLKNIYFQIKNIKSCSYI